MDQIAPPPNISWRAGLDELAKSMRIARQTGSAERIASQHAGRWQAMRERVVQSLDPRASLENRLDRRQDGRDRFRQVARPLFRTTRAYSADVGLTRKEIDRLTKADVIGPVRKPRRPQSDQ